MVVVVDMGSWWSMGLLGCEWWWRCVVVIVWWFFLMGFDGWHGGGYCGYGG